MNEIAIIIIVAIVGGIIVGDFLAKAFRKKEIIKETTPEEPAQ